MKQMFLKTVVAAVAIAGLAGCGKENGSGSSSKPDITRDLKAYYSFNSDLLTDSSSSNQGGAVNHGAVLTTDHLGNPNSAALFADSAYIEIPASSNTDFTKDLTLNAWVNLSNTQSTELLTAVVSKGDSSNYIWQMGVSQNYASGEYGTGQDWILKYVSLKETSPLTVGQWYMFTMTVSKAAGTVTLYVNNAQVASFTEKGITSTDVSVANGNPILIGMERSRHFWFDGKVDDLRMYNRVISAEEMSQLYAQ